METCKYAKLVEGRLDCEWSQLFGSGEISIECPTKGVIEGNVCPVAVACQDVIEASRQNPNLVEYYKSLRQVMSELPTK